MPTVSNPAPLGPVSSNEEERTADADRLTQGYVLVERAHQAAILRSNPDLKLDQFEVVALTPEADYALEKTGTRYRSIDAFYSEPVLIDKGLDNYKRVAAFCDDFDMRFRRHITEKAAVDLFTAHYFYYWLKVLFDSLLNRTFMLQSVIKSQDPKMVAYFPPERETIEDNLFFINESIAPHLVPQLSNLAGCSVRLLDSGMARRFQISNGKQSISLKLQLADWLQLMPGGGKLLRRAKVSRELGTWWHRDGHREDVPTLIAIQRGYDMTALVRYWRERNLGNLVMWEPRLDDSSRGRPGANGPESQQRQALENLLSEAKGDPDFRQYFTMGEVDTFNAAETRIEHFALKVVPEFLNRATEFGRVLDRYSSPVVLGTPAVLVPQVAAFATAVQRGVPAVVYQHGGAWGQMNLPMIEHHDFHLGTHVMCYGQGVVDYCATPSDSARRAEFKRRAKFIVAGSSALDELVSRRANTGRKQRFNLATGTGKRVVVYVTTNFSGDKRYFNYHTYPDIWYWHLQRSVMENQRSVMENCSNMPQSGFKNSEAGMATS